MCISALSKFLILTLLNRNTPLLVFLKDTSEILSVRNLVTEVQYNLKFFLNILHI